jgi:hypothetical protein
MPAYTRITWRSGRPSRPSPNFFHAPQLARRLAQLPPGSQVSGDLGSVGSTRRVERYGLGPQPSSSGFLSVAFLAKLRALVTDAKDRAFG